MDYQKLKDQTADKVRALLELHRVPLGQVGGRMDASERIRLNYLVIEHPALMAELAQLADQVKHTSTEAEVVHPMLQRGGYGVALDIEWVEWLSSLLGIEPAEVEGVIFAALKAGIVAAPVKAMRAPQPEPIPYKTAEAKIGRSTAERLKELRLERDKAIREANEIRKSTDAGVEEWHRAKEIASELIHRVKVQYENDARKLIREAAEVRKNRAKAEREKHLKK